jgi:hypothetical protein
MMKSLYGKKLNRDIKALHDHYGKYKYVYDFIVFDLGADCALKVMLFALVLIPSHSPRSERSPRCITKSLAVTMALSPKRAPSSGFLV